MDGEKLQSTRWSPKLTIKPGLAQAPEPRTPFPHPLSFSATFTFYLHLHLHFNLTVTSDSPLLSLLSLLPARPPCYVAYQSRISLPLQFLPL
jgi:hypothetical protein